MQVIHKSWLEPLTLPGRVPIRLEVVWSNTLRDALKNANLGIGIFVARSGHD